MADQDDSAPKLDVRRLAADVVASYVAQNSLPAGQVADLIRSVYSSFGQLGEASSAASAPAEKQKPAVPVSRSVQDDFIVCLEDGAKLKMLKRYLRSKYGLSPDEYRRKWGLPPDYPMVAPAYAARRSAFAKEIGLGKGVRRKK
jgi:predicted transcriptional regulator